MADDEPIDPRGSSLEEAKKRAKVAEKKSIELQNELDELVKGVKLSKEINKLYNAIKNGEIKASKENLDIIKAAVTENIKASKTNKSYNESWNKLLRIREDTEKRLLDERQEELIFAFDRLKKEKNNFWTSQDVYNKNLSKLRKESAELESLRSGTKKVLNEQNKWESKALTRKEKDVLLSNVRAKQEELRHKKYQEETNLYVTHGGNLAKIKKAELNLENDTLQRKIDVLKKDEERNKIFSKDEAKHRALLIKAYGQKQAAILGKSYDQGIQSGLWETFGLGGIGKTISNMMISKKTGGGAGGILKAGLGGLGMGVLKSGGLNTLAGRFSGEKNEEERDKFIKTSEEYGNVNSEKNKFKSGDRNKESSKETKSESLLSGILKTLKKMAGIEEKAAADEAEWRDDQAQQGGPAPSGEKEIVTQGGDKGDKKKGGLGMWPLLIAAVGSLIYGLFTNGPFKGLAKIIGKTMLDIFGKVFSGSAIGKLASGALGFLKKGIGTLFTKVAGSGGLIGKVIGKIGGSGIGQVLGKFLTKIPIIGTLINVGFAISRFMKGDIIGGLVDIGSALAMLLPPPFGTILSTGLSGLNAFLDIKTGNKPGAKASLMKGVMSSIGNFIVTKVPFVSGLIDVGSGFKDILGGDVKKGLKSVGKGLFKFTPVGAIMDVINSIVGDDKEEEKAKAGAGSETKTPIAAAVETKTPIAAAVEKKKALQPEAVVPEKVTKKPEVKAVPKESKTVIVIKKNSDQELQKKVEQARAGAMFTPEPTTTEVIMPESLTERENKRLTERFRNTLAAQRDEQSQKSMAAINNIVQNKTEHNSQMVLVNSPKSEM